MEPNLALSDSDWGLLIELLQREQKQLLVEIRHTDAAAYRAQIRERLAQIDHLLEQLAVAAT